MSRVLLMVDNGDGRVKCAGPWCPQEMTYADRARRHGTKAQRAKQRSAARWWLVEAASADDARDVIAGAPLFGGRILAQGSRQ